MRCVVFMVMVTFLTGCRKSDSFDLRSLDGIVSVKSDTSGKKNSQAKERKRDKKRKKRDRRKI